MHSCLKDKIVLVIDDDEEYLKSVNRLFENFVSHIYHAFDTISATHILDTFPIDFIVCDVVLGEENGLKFIRNLREHNENIPIIVISGQIDIEYLLQSIPLNLVAYLQKPIEYSSFILALQNCSKKLCSLSPQLIYVKNDYYYDATLKVIKKDNKVYKLHHKEILFIEMLINNRNSVMSKDMFYVHVWQFQEMSDSALKNFILRIRRRFGKEFIEAVNNVGYRFAFFITLEFNFYGNDLYTTL
jgi:DNA-binding response OmpR family regulator